MSQRASAANPRRGRTGRIHSGISKLFGFGLSVILLGVASLAAIPAMIAADGEVAWGAIALGQSIGAIGSVVAAYGWALFGPAEIAGATATERRVAYLESILARVVLLLPTALVAASLAFVLAPGRPVFAAVAAVSTTSTGLTASWYFVGLARPYAMLVLETIPRVTGTAAGIVLMGLGHSAVAVPVSTFVGIVAGFAITTSWVLRATVREGAERAHPRALRVVLYSRRHGLATDVAWATLYATPLMIVSTVAPAIQPTFALADKVQTQIHSMLAPARAVLQGWVPRVTGSARARRAGTALLIAAGFAIAVGAAMIVVTPALMGWLGNGQISVSWDVVLLVAACGTLNSFVRSMELVALAPFGRLHIAARAIIVSFVGLPTVALGAMMLGTIGALSGVLVCLLICALIESTDYVRSVRPLSRDAFQSPLQ